MQKNVQIIITIKAIATIPPISSQMAEKIKSFETTGILVGIPLPSPLPIHPPAPIAKSDCDI